MSLFCGEYEGKMDGKARLVLPARLKAHLPQEAQSNVVITRGFEPCLVLYTLPCWQKIMSKIMALNEFDEQHRSFQRNFLRGCTELELDSNGRFLLPRQLLLYAGIEKEAIFAGLGNRIEIWNPFHYQHYLVQDQHEFSNIAQKFLASNHEQLPHSRHAGGMPGGTEHSAR